MNSDQQEREFIEKSQAVSLAILKTIQDSTAKEPAPMDIKIALLALTKVSASVLYQMSLIADDREELFDLFIGTIFRSMASLDELEESKEAADKVIRKLRGMQ